MIGLKTTSELFIKIDAQPVEIKQLILKSLGSELRGNVNTEKLKTVYVKRGGARASRSSRRDVMALESKILDYVRDHGAVSTRDVRRDVDPARAVVTINKYLNKLVKKDKLLQKARNGQIVEYMVTTKAESLPSKFFG